MKNFIATGYGKATIFAAALVPTSIFFLSGVSSADTVDDGFTGVQASLTGYLGDAVALVLAIVGLSVGIRMLVRWAKRAASA